MSRFRMSCRLLALVVFLSPLVALQARGQAAAECTYDTTKPPVADYRALLSPGDAMRGNKNAGVTVIDVFEPNCPHCKTMHTVMAGLAKKYAGVASFYYKPVMFWPERSLVQMQALYHARTGGKFFAMLDKQFDAQRGGGLKIDTLRHMAKAIGMDPKVMADKIAAGAYTDAIMAERKKLVDGAGIRSVPAVLINGRYVKAESRTAACLGKLIEQASQGL